MVVKNKPKTLGRPFSWTRGAVSWLVQEKPFVWETCVWKSTRLQEVYGQVSRANLPVSIKGPEKAEDWRVWGEGGVKKKITQTTAKKSRAQSGEVHDPRHCSKWKNWTIGSNSTQSPDGSFCSTHMGQIQKTVQCIWKLRWFGIALKKQGGIGRLNIPGLDASAGSQPPRWSPVPWHPSAHTLSSCSILEEDSRSLHVLWEYKGCAFAIGSIYSSSLYWRTVLSCIILQRGTAWQGTVVQSASMEMNLEVGYQDAIKAMLTLWLHHHKGA